MGSEVGLRAKYSNSSNVLGFFSVRVGKEASDCLHQPPRVTSVYTRPAATQIKVCQAKTNEV